MWQRFTERARRSVFYAQEEAGRLGWNYVSTEHMLLGLMREDDSVAVRSLEALGIVRDRLRQAVEEQVAHGDGAVGQDMQLTPRAKRCIDLAYEEARALGNDYIGTEHLLIGLLREGEGLACRVLVRLGADVDSVRATVAGLQSTAERTVRHVEDAIQAARRHVTADTFGLRGSSLLSLTDLNADQLSGVLVVAAAMRAARSQGIRVTDWSGKRSLALVFEKASLRTRVTFELGMKELGGHAIVLGPAEIGLGTRESVPDVARNLERWVSAIMARVFDHGVLTVMHRHTSIPIINALSDVEHPCQAIADLQTILQHGKEMRGLRIAWVGDGNNVLHSLMIGASLLGASVVAACPTGYEPSEAIVRSARESAGYAEAVQIVTDPEEAVEAADVVYTDTWTSMGQEAEAEARRRVFAPYQVNARLMARAKPDALFMHCLPAHRGEEATDEVLDGKNSVILDQAENRLHAQKAVLALLIGP